jgi:hypothetical protein
MPPFLTSSGFIAMWDGPTLTAQQQNQLTLLLQVASNWVYARVNGISSTDPTAQLVIFGVISNFLRYSKYSPLSNYHKAVGHRIEAGTLAADVTRFFTDDDKLLLGIPLKSLPMSSCVPNDFDAPDQNQGWPTCWSDQSNNLGWDFWTLNND